MEVETIVGNHKIEVDVIVGNYKSDDGKDYFELALDLTTLEFVMIKNAGCTAAAFDLANNYFGYESQLYARQNIKIFFHGNEAEPNLKFIPKKYHKAVDWYFN